MIQSILSQFPTITLQQMSAVKLMNRIDTKFVTSVDRLCLLMEMARQSYHVQQIDGNLIAPYQTIYYDTPEMTMYTAHHNGHLNRQKVRIRSYVDSDLHFLEVKTKDNHRRTHKKRINVLGSQADSWDAQITSAEGEAALFLSERLRVCDHRELIPVIENRFSRITLVNQARTERLTIDTDLRFVNRITGRKLHMGNFAVVELKRDGLQHSPVLQMLLDLRIFPQGFSKYCMGLAMTNPQLKQNRFKERLRYVERIVQ